MNMNIESDVVELLDDGFFFADTEVPVYQVLSDIASGTSLADIAEEYDVEESVLAQFLQDLSESFR